MEIPRMKKILVRFFEWLQSKMPPDTTLKVHCLQCGSPEARWNHKSWKGYCPRCKWKWGIGRN